MQVRFFKVTTLPATLQPDSFYLVQNSSYAESYLTDSSGNAKSIGNSAMITAVANAAINSALSHLNEMEVVSNIAARNSLGSASQKNLIILVTDATGDPTVNSGAATYAYNATTQTYTKIAEYESMDVVVQWANIQGKPTSTPAAIDNAVTLAHSHSNKATLDKISEDAEGLLFGGAAPAPRWTTLNW